MAFEPLNVLILGASYGLLPGVKLALAGHRLTLVGRRDEIARMAEGDLELRLRDRRTGRDVILRAPVASQADRGKVALRTPEQADPAAADFVIFAMQEPQYRDPAVAALAQDIAALRRPILSIMNLPPPPFLRRLGIAAPDALAGVYASAELWRHIDPRKLTNASPDAQALRTDPDAPGRLTVTLASNFKAAPLAEAADQALLERLAHDLSHLKIEENGATIRPPVAMLAHRSPFAPLLKWPMLIAGNCRCVAPDGIRSIRDAVLADIEASRAIYEQVSALVLGLGAEAKDMVAFAAYAKAAEQLDRPSSLARGLAAGATAVERIDRLVLNLMRMNGRDIASVAPIVATIQDRLERNAATHA